MVRVIAEAAPVFTEGAAAAGGNRVREAVRKLMPREALTTAVTGLLTVLETALKAALFVPPGTVTDEGTVKLEMSSAIATDVEVEAVRFKVTMQRALAGVTRDAGVQFSALTANAKTVMLPPVEVIGIGPPDIRTPLVFARTIVVPVATPGESVTFTVATTPFATTFEFNPVSRHTYVPGVAEQTMDLPASAAAGPVATFTDMMSDVE